MFVKNRFKFIFGQKQRIGVIFNVDFVCLLVHMSNRLFKRNIIHCTDRKHTCILKPMRILKYSGELREEDTVLRDELLLSALRLNIINNDNNNNNNNIKSRQLSKTTEQRNVEIMDTSTKNISGPSDMKTGMTNLKVRTKSTKSSSCSPKAESTVTCSINGNSDQNKSEEFSREHLSNSKYFDPAYLQVAAQKMSSYLKTILKTDESQKENRPLKPTSFDESRKENRALNPSSSFGGSRKENRTLNHSSLNGSQKENRPLNASSCDGSQNISEVLTPLREHPIRAANRKRILREAPNNITPLDPQVEFLTCHIDRYPSIYVSQSGLINVLLRQGILLEVTVDKAIRLVDLNQDMAAAVSGRSKACSVNHRSVKICQSKSSADIDLGDLWQAKIRTGQITVGDRRRSVWFDEAGNFGTSEYSKYQFVDTNLTDYTVDLLLTSASYGSALIPLCKKLVSAAKFESTRIGSVSVQVNDVKVIQKSPGDVVVMSGSKLLKMRPRAQSVEIHTGSTEIAVSPEWGVTCHLRKCLSLTCSNQQLTVSNGNIESRLKRDGQIELRKVSDVIP